MPARYRNLIANIANGNGVYCGNFPASGTGLLTVPFVSKRDPAHEDYPVFDPAVTTTKLNETAKVALICDPNCLVGKHIRTIKMVRNVAISMQILVLKD